LGWFSCGGQISAAAEYDGRLYCAAGTEGVFVLSPDLTPKEQIPVRRGGIVFDLQIRPGRLYCAAGAEGLEVYELGSGRPKLQKKAVFHRGACRGVRVSSDGRYALLVLASNTVALFDLREERVVWENTATFILYHRNLWTAAGGRYLGYARNGGEERWFDFGGGGPRPLPALPRTRIGTSSGACEEGEGLLASCASCGFLRYTPGEAASLATRQPIPAPEELYGLPALSGSLLASSHRIRGRLSLGDMSDPEHPRLLKVWQFAGHPDIPLFVGEHLLVPLGYEGLALLKDIIPGN
jgi:hypothetical protein